MRLRDRTDRLSIGDKIAITIVIAIALLILLAFFGFLTGRWDDANAAPAPPPAAGEKLRHTCVTDVEARERLRTIMFGALDDGLTDQLKRLFQNWMADDRGQPERARVGVSQAFRAHQIARQLAIEWAPPLCEQERR